jgi:hypothetical protein
MEQHTLMSLLYLKSHEPLHDQVVSNVAPLLSHDSTDGVRFTEVVSSIAIADVSFSFESDLEAKAETVALER